ncbi:MAG TPA: hypothetical protein VLB81_05450 [Gaiellales bacterium]|nr:hypothetical protein [Gaiellales bacterium]
MIICGVMGGFGGRTRVVVADFSGEVSCVVDGVEVVNAEVAVCVGAWGDECDECDTGALDVSARIATAYPPARPATAAASTPKPVRRARRARRRDCVRSSSREAWVVSCGCSLVISGHAGTGRLPTLGTLSAAAEPPRNPIAVAAVKRL